MRGFDLVGSNSVVLRMLQMLHLTDGSLRGSLAQPSTFPATLLSAALAVGMSVALVLLQRP